MQGAVLAGLSAAGSGQQSMRSVAGQVAFAGVSGACVGAYLMWEFFLGEAPLQVRRSLCPLLRSRKSERCSGNACCMHLLSEKTMDAMRLYAVFFIKVLAGASAEGHFIRSFAAVVLWPPYL